MNLKIDRVLPYPPSITQPSILIYVTIPKPALLLYAPPPPPQKPEQPKKKFAFKASAAPVNTVQPVHLFQFDCNQWRTQQTKGKFPSRRDHAAKVCLGPCLLIYGGNQLTPAKQLNDLYCLNLNTWQWKKLFTMEAPPAQPAPLALATEDKFIVLTSQIWIFSAKGVSWETESTDLPGGVWQKVSGLQLPFKPLSTCFYQQQIIIFGVQAQINVASINIETKRVTPLSVEGQIKTKCQSIAITATSQGKGLCIDGTLFCGFVIHNNVLFITGQVQSEEIFQNVAAVSNQNLKINYGITTKKQLVSAQLIIPIAEEAAQLQQPNTARQLVREEQSPRSSVIQRQQLEPGSTSRPLQSPLSVEGPNNPIFTRLSPLLAREWLRRHLLEEKSKLLEDTIKKAEKMVLVLCKYGDEESKQRHINKVCRMRQNLCKVLQSETFIRKQMAQRPGEKQLRTRAVQEEHGCSFFDPNQI